MKQRIFTNHPLAGVRRRAFATLVAFAALATSAQAQTLHLITVGNPEGFPAEAAKRDVKKDLDNIRDLFIDNVPEAQFNHVDVSAANVYKVNSAIANLPVESDDVVVFYFSGHSGNELDDGGQAFQLFKKDADGKPTGEERIHRKDIRAKLAQRAPRLVVILSDCCNAYMAPLPDPKVIHTYPKEPTPLAQKLFFEPKGCVDMTSSKFGEYSYTGTGESGSLWTCALIEVFNEAGETLKNDPKATIDWRKIADQTIEKTQKSFQAKYPNGSPEGQTTQTPYVYELPDDPRLGARVQTHQLSLTVTEVIPGSPAEKAGLQVGDQLLELRYCDTNEVKRLVDEADYSAAIDAAPRDIELTIQREVGKKTEKRILTVELAGLPDSDEEDPVPVPPDPEPVVVANLGVTVLGQEITKIDAGSRAEKAGLEVGDKIFSFNGAPIETGEDLQNAAAEEPIGAPLEILKKSTNEQTHVVVAFYKPGVPMFGATVQGQKVTNVVANSPAAIAGLEVGDQLLTFNDAKIANAKDFEKAVDASDVEAQIVVRKKSTNQEMTLSVFLNINPNQPVPVPVPDPDPVPDGPVFGATVQGQTITVVVADSPAAKAGLKVGDKILKFNNTPIKSADDYSKAVDASPANATLVVQKKGSYQQTRINVRLNKSDDPQPEPAKPDVPQPEPAKPDVPQPEPAKPDVPVQPGQPVQPEQPVFGATFDANRKITKVVPGSPAAQAGLKVGETIFSFNGTTLNTAQELSQLIDQSPAEGAWARVGNEKQTRDVQFKLNK